MYWSTMDEKNYIDGLVDGRFLMEGRYPSLSKATLLRNYINSASKRVLWGTFEFANGNECVAYAAEKLAAL